MEEKNRVKLKICGSEFIIIADESTEYIKDIANRVDRQIHEYSDENPKMSISMGAMLSALNYCDQYEKEKRITNELIKKADRCEAEASKANSMLADFAIENSQLLEEKKGLHKVIADLKSQLRENNIEERTNLLEDEQANLKSQQVTQSSKIPVASNAQQHQDNKQTSLKNEQQHQNNQQPVVKQQPAYNNNRHANNNHVNNKNKKLNEKKTLNSNTNHQVKNSISDDYKNDEFLNEFSEEEILSFFDQSGYNE